MRVFRFAAPLAAVAVVALAPAWLLALATRTPATPVDAASLTAHAVTLIAFAILGQLALVGGAAAMAEATSQRDALRRGLGGLGRAVVPCMLALIAITVAGIALVVPGVLAVAMFAMTGAAAALEPGPSSLALRRSAAAARGQLKVVAAIAIGAVVVDVAIAAVAHRVVIAGGGKHALSDAVVYLRIVALGLVAVSPPIAAVLAARYARNRAR